jgi:rubrerythrin
MKKNNFLSIEAKECPFCGRPIDDDGKCPHCG